MAKVIQPARDQREAKYRSQHATIDGLRRDVWRSLSLADMILEGPVDGVEIPLGREIVAAPGWTAIKLSYTSEKDTYLSKGKRWSIIPFHYHMLSEESLVVTEGTCFCLLKVGRFVKDIILTKTQGGIVIPKGVSHFFLALEDCAMDVSLSPPLSKP